MKKRTFVIGHKNPDTDSVVAAVAYARLKQILGDDSCVAARAGKLNPQTEYIFKKFSVEPPQFLSDLNPRVEFFMRDDFKATNANQSLWSAISVMQKNKNQVVPVIDDDGKYCALLHYSAFAKSVLNTLNPARQISVTTNVELISQTLNAQPVNIENPAEIFKATILVGAAQEQTFLQTLSAHASENVIVITGDREDIQKICVEKKVRVLVVTAGKIPCKEIRNCAKENGVSILTSPYDTSSTAMLIFYSTPVSLMADCELKPVFVTDTIAKIRPLLRESESRALPVIAKDGKALGIISENDLLNEPNVSVILVDHNEQSQAIEGVEHYTIKEILDHHRISSMTTRQPIFFINSPLGSTSTIIAAMYKANKISVPKDIAPLLLCGILSDTLILQSGTTTESDCEIAEYLAAICDCDLRELGEEIIEAGSRVGQRTADEIIRQDMKNYTAGTIKFTASQIEVGNTDEILKRKIEFLDELEITRRAEGGIFSVLLVTDITTLSSVMLIAADPKFLASVSLPQLEERIYYLKDVVSRKKQLIPLLYEQISRYWE